MRQIGRWFLAKSKLFCYGIGKCNKGTFLLSRAGDIVMDSGLDRAFEYGALSMMDRAGHRVVYSMNIAVSRE